MQYMYEAMSASVDAVEQFQMKLLWPPSPSRFSNISHFVFAVVGFGALELQGLLGHGTFDLVFRDIVPPAIGGVAFLSLLGVLIAWLFMLMNYRRQVLDIRGGRLTDFNVKSVNVFAATSYPGYQAVHCIVVRVLACVLLRSPSKEVTIVPMSCCRASSPSSPFCSSRC